MTEFEQTPGVVKKIDGTSQQLKNAIAGGARIIVTTIQKFSTDHLKALSGQGHRTFAVIVDEAHSSQSGKSAQAMKGALTRTAHSSDDIEELIADYQAARGPQANISFFAFTATPRNVTLERFGVKGEDGLPHPFHLYSMRQAIEEGFILDVLQNYMTYTAYYKLEKAIEDDPELSGRKGQREVARYASLHPTAIGQKVEIIVEHFCRHVMQQLNGQAKAMIVTQSREHALRYWERLKDYIADKGYKDIRALVAFSGDLEIDGNVWTEAAANGFSETELPGRFDTDKYHILIVAEKYQTGFDQPKLCAMYVDRKLAGLQAVQTLSRLNRKRAGKTHTFILDFQNSMEDIRDAFKPFYEATSVEEMSDPNQIYDLETRLFTFGYLDRDEIASMPSSPRLSFSMTPALKNSHPMAPGSPACCRTVRFRPRSKSQMKCSACRRSGWTIRNRAAHPSPRATPRLWPLSATLAQIPIRRTTRKSYRRLCRRSMTATVRNFPSKT